MERCLHAWVLEHERFIFMIISALRTPSVALDNSARSEVQRDHTTLQSTWWYEDILAALEDLDLLSVGQFPTSKPAKSHFTF